MPAFFKGLNSLNLVKQHDFFSCVSRKLHIPLSIINIKRMSTTSLFSGLHPLLTTSKVNHSSLALKYTFQTVSYHKQRWKKCLTISPCMGVHSKFPFLFFKFKKLKLYLLFFILNIYIVLKVTFHL